MCQQSNCQNGYKFHCVWQINYSEKCETGFCCFFFALIIFVENIKMFFDGKCNWNLRHIPTAQTNEVLHRMFFSSGLFTFWNLWKFFMTVYFGSVSGWLLNYSIYTSLLLLFLCIFFFSLTLRFEVQWNDAFILRESMSNTLTVIVVVAVVFVAIVWYFAMFHQLDPNEPMYKSFETFI